MQVVRIDGRVRITVSRDIYSVYRKVLSFSPLETYLVGIMISSSFSLLVFHVRWPR